MLILFAGLSAFIHLYIFCLESLWWGRPKTNKVFKVTLEQAEANRLFAFNQGFYNLFLALNSLVGICLIVFEINQTVAKTLLASSNLSMLLAAIVLVSKGRHLLRAALIQGVAPLLVLISLLLSF